MKTALNEAIGNSELCACNVARRPDMGASPAAGTREPAGEA